MTKEQVPSILAIKRHDDASVFKPDGSGDLALVARMPAAAWIKAAKGQ